MTVRLSSAAEHEYATSALYYLEQSPQAALDFVDEMDAALLSIEESPERYSFWAEDIRVRYLDRFPFSIFYQVRTDEVWVVSVSHDARRPGYWRGRI